MRVSYARCLAVCAVLVISMGFAQATFAAEILIADAKSQPESLTMAPGGVLIVGSASSPFVYKSAPGSSTPRSLSTPAQKARGRFSSACWRTPPATRCGHVN